jgi:hypothetical protein
MSHKHFDDPEFDAKFWSRVRFTETCWIWTAGIGGTGYGQIYFKRKSETVHRRVWRLYNGEIPDSMFVLHRCDVRECCNPEHLFLGTPKDNTADMIAKGRDRFPKAGHNAPKGEANHHSKLTEEIVAEIRRRYAAGGVRQVDLGAEYGISGAHVCGIVKGRFWKVSFQKEQAES